METIKTGKKPAKLIGGLSEVASSYDAFIIDLWGVMHNGYNVFPAASEVLKHLRAQGKKTVLLTNAPRPTELVKQSLLPKGISPEEYDFLHSSGEDCRDGFQSVEATGNHSDQPQQRYRDFGRKIFHLGSQIHQSLYQDLGYERVSSVEEADMVLVSASLEKGESLDLVLPDLTKALARSLPLICANPDTVVYMGDEKLVCCGAFALWYEQQGGRVFWHGKPFPSVYQTVLKEIGLNDPSKACVIGDNLRTDIPGGNRQGMGSVLIASGVHRTTLVTQGDSVEAGLYQGKEALERTIAAEGNHAEQYPDYVLTWLRW